METAVHKSHSTECVLRALKAVLLPLYSSSQVDPVRVIPCLAAVARCRTSPNYILRGLPLLRRHSRAFYLEGKKKREKRPYDL